MTSAFLLKMIFKLKILLKGSICASQNSLITTPGGWRSHLYSSPSLFYSSVYMRKFVYVISSQFIKIFKEVNFLFSLSASEEESTNTGASFKKQSYLFIFVFLSWTTVALGKILCFLLQNLIPILGSCYLYLDCGLSSSVWLKMTQIESLTCVKYLNCNSNNGKVGDLSLSPLVQ